jgi:hypothetical protein
MGSRYVLIQDKKGRMISSSALAYALATTPEPGAPIH